MSKLTQSARNQDCQIRIDGICNHDNTTTVLAHLPGGGMAGKKSDIHGAYACSDCHAVVDGANYHGHTFNTETLKLWHLEGVIRTQLLMIDQGLITI